MPLPASARLPISRMFRPPTPTPRARARNGEAVPGYSEWAGTGTGGRDDGDYNLEAFVSAETTLADHLAEQLALAVADPARRMIGQYLIDLVDEAGYLSGDLAQVAEKLGAPRAEVEAVLAILQGFDPPGVCARNLNECLAIQLKERDRFDPAMQALVGHLDLLAKRDLAALRRLCGVSDEDLADMIGEIRQLNPKPGLAFGSTLVQPIVPDVFVRRGPTAASSSSSIPTRCPRCWSTRATTPRSPRPRRTTRTRPISPTACRPPPGSIRALDQRAKTILKVSTRDRAPAGRFLRPRRPASAPAQPQDHRRRHRRCTN